MKAWIAKSIREDEGLEEPEQDVVIVDIHREKSSIVGEAIVGENSYPATYITASDSWHVDRIKPNK